MSVFREVTINYGGEEYTFTPSMQLLRSIEHGDGNGPVSLISLISEAEKGQPQMSIMAWLVAKVMRHAGADVAEEEVYQGMANAEKEARELYFQVMAALSPSQKEQKKSVPKEE